MRPLSIGLTIGAVALAMSGVGFAQSEPADDAAFATEVWELIAEQRLVGPEALGAVPYLRQGEAHAASLVTLLSTISVNGTDMEVIVKRSYEGEGATRDAIIANPTENLSNITVMVKREAGYDPDNQDWFWAMYMPDGSVGEMEGMQMAGRVEMCTACHSAAPGGDYLFLHD